MQKRVRIGDLLVENQLITEGQLEIALSEQKKTGNKLGKTAVNLGFISEDRLVQVVSKQLKIPYVDLSQYQIQQDMFLLLSEANARRFRAIPYAQTADSVMVAMEDPTDLLALDQIKRMIKSPVEVALVKERDLEKLFEIGYRKTEKITSLANELQSQLVENHNPNYSVGLTDDENENTPVVRLLQSLFEDAVRLKASDIHIEPEEKFIRIRQRIDGMLQEFIVNERSIFDALVMRLKIMAGLNISEKRLPQDGRFKIVIHHKNIDVRISTLPVQWGESVVMRLLDHSTGIRPLEALGMDGAMLERYNRMVSSPNGMVLVTGPTGSGKTSTLYATLYRINSEDKKIITVEDPVEYVLPRVNQVQVNNKIDLTFSNVLRASLRQDPDIVLVGEIRDAETVKIALSAAMTGHLVFSTLHTNDAVSAALRLIDMGAEPYLIGPAVIGVLAQRLVRSVCEVCSEPYAVTEKERRYLQSIMGASEQRLALENLRVGAGCNNCNNTGYSGRFGIYELLEFDEEMDLALQASDYETFKSLALNQPGYQTLQHQALAAALSGKTTLAEVFRVCHQ